MRTILLIAALTLVGAFSARADDPLDEFLKQVDAQAKPDIERFQRTLSAQFNVPEADVHAVYGGIRDPGAVFMIFQLGQWSHKPLHEVLSVYDSHQGTGWTSMAKELGIQPGSAEYYALKNGDLHYGPRGKTKPK